MLSRTADHLYWMSRYLERAVNLARMIDAHQRLALLPRSPEAVRQGWQATLVSLGMDGAYEQRYGAVTPRAAFNFLAFDREHPGSILQCVRSARENARAVRGTITSDMWETLNETYLDSASFNSTMPESARGDFLEWVKYRAHLTRGITSGTLLRDEAAHFTHIGTFLERADNTTRMLEARWRDPGGRGERLLEEASEWAVLLRAMSAFEVFRRLYRDSVTPLRVTQMLLMRDDLPQGVHRCLSELRANLAAVANEQSSETLRRVGELHAQFQFGRFEELCAEGVPWFLDRFQARLRDLGQRIANDFLVPSGTY
ncbi:MAG TPA: alpha-E domain-containing protein [Steroidobacteraceae bacterium]|nr:alpha-E domain-containing protein [Steroidobacteraceae bacterium]